MTKSKGRILRSAPLTILDSTSTRAGAQSPRFDSTAAETMMRTFPVLAIDGYRRLLTAGDRLRNFVSRIVLDRRSLRVVVVTRPAHGLLKRRVQNVSSH